MKRSDFAIGQEFWCSGKRWRCTDIGARVIVAICLEQHDVISTVPGERPGDFPREVRSITNDPQWLVGPPYAVAESVFDEHDIEACSLTANVERP
jgi:hypothetical protein